MPRRWIYAQGDFDGACFLYSIGNAYVALRHKPADFARICAAMAQVEHPGDFLNGGVGTTGAYDKKYALLEDAMRRMLAALAGTDANAPRFEVARIAGPFETAMLTRSIGPRSVVILRYQGSSSRATGMDHWVCAVDYDAPADAVHVACSVALHRTGAAGAGAPYKEIFNERYGRWSNDALTKKRAHTVIEDEVFQVTLLP
ncbi:MAG: hypothetical protein AUJ49_09495 [Desulfovibrionaceae bacterium CG1_02_65_16]|nr:MAG: hypothetical protein AUJ49_09495 [Desulfovibrionaceae bacterium CG1_02_65_16]